MVYIENVPVVTSWMMACEGHVTSWMMTCEDHVTSCDFSSSWVCPAVDEERQLWDTSLEAADCKVASNTAGMIHCVPTWCYSQDEHDQAFYLTLLLPCIISTQRSRINKRGRLKNALKLSHFCLCVITQVDSLTASPSSEWHAWCMCVADVHKVLVPVLYKLLLPY